MQQYLGDSTDDEDAGRESVPHFSGEDRVQDQCDSTGDKASCDVNTSSSWSPMRPRPPEKQFAKPSWSRMMELDRHVLSVSGARNPLCVAVVVACVALLLVFVICVRRLHLFL